MFKPGKCGVYRIVCVVTKQVYVGSSGNIPSRWWHHRWNLKRGIHSNPRLQEAWQTHGTENFQFEVVELVPDPVDLPKREQFWLDRCQASEPRHGFNRSPSAFTVLGMKRRDIVARLSQQWVITAPDGTEYRITNLKAFCRAWGLTHDSMGRIAKGEFDNHNGGWKCRKASMTEEEWKALRASKAGREKSEAMSKDWVLVDPTGHEHHVRNLRVFCQANNLNNALLCMVAKGMRPHHKGWTCRPA